jgi:hypothetical protein
MKQNIGTADRVLRFIAALIIAILYLSDIITGTLALILGFFAVVFIVTSFIGVCPLYILLKLSTRKNQSISA